MTTLGSAPVGADARTEPTSLAELRTSAKGWHGVQLAVLGFIGLCGALKEAGTSDSPAWLQQLAGVLVLVALAVACVATILVASAAWPVYGSTHATASTAEEIHTSGRRLRTGIVLTFLAVVVLGIATSSSWWPSTSGAGDEVVVSTNGGSVCGTLQESEPGTVAIQTTGQRIVIAVGEVVSLRPTAGCP